MEILDIIVRIALVIFGSAGFWQLIQNRASKKDSADKLLLGLAFCEITRMAENYIARGYITTQEYNELNRYLFQPYTERGGNGTAARLMEEVKKLPTQIEHEEV